MQTMECEITCNYRCLRGDTQGHKVGQEGSRERERLHGVLSSESRALERQGLLAEGTCMCKTERSETQGSWNWLEHTWSLRKRRDVGLEERGRGPTLQALDGPAEECQPG